MKVAMSLDG